MLYFVALSPQSCSLSPNQKFISGLPKSKGLPSCFILLLSLPKVALSPQIKSLFQDYQRVKVYSMSMLSANVDLPKEKRYSMSMLSAIDLPKVYSMFMLNANVALQTACLWCKGVAGNHNILLRILYWLYVSSFVLRAICFLALCYEFREKVSKAKGADLSSCPENVVKQTVFVVSDIVQCGLTHCSRTEINLVRGFRVLSQDPSQLMCCYKRIIWSEGVLKGSDVLVWPTLNLKFWFTRLHGWWQMFHLSWCSVLWVHSDFIEEVLFDSRVLLSRSRASFHSIVLKNKLLKLLKFYIGPNDSGSRYPWVLWLCILKQASPRCHAPFFCWC